MLLTEMHWAMKTRNPKSETNSNRENTKLLRLGSSHRHGRKNDSHGCPLGNSSKLSTQGAIVLESKVERIPGRNGLEHLDFEFVSNFGFRICRYLGLKIEALSKRHSRLTFFPQDGTRSLNIELPTSNAQLRTHTFVARGCSMLGL